jgi:hypothetical protein
MVVIGRPVAEGYRPVSVWRKTLRARSKKAPRAIEAYPPTPGRTGPITVVGAIGGTLAHRREESLQVMRGFLRNQTNQLLIAAI